MSHEDLNVLERDVEQARARFAGDLARLRSPDTLSSFKDDVWARAVETKDELVEKAKDAAAEGVQRLVTDVKERVSSNPAAALAIAAGLAWRLAHRPPIASLLVGVGLLSLWRATPSDDNDGIVPRAVELAGQVKEKVQEWSAEAGETLAHLADKVSTTADQAYASAREVAGMVKETATVAADRAASAGQEAAMQVRDQGKAAGDKTSAALRDFAPSEEARDTLLLGATATAALGIAYQRRSMD
jgi:hypothetical protein